MNRAHQIYAGPYGQPNGNGNGNGNGYSPLQYALVFGVGLVLSAVLRVPITAGAALYVLGFWIRGRPQTYALLAQVGGIAQTQATTAQGAWQQVQTMRAQQGAAAAAADARSAAAHMPAPWITQPPGAGVVSAPGAGMDPSSVISIGYHERVHDPTGLVYIDRNGNQVIDASAL